MPRLGASVPALAIGALCMVLSTMILFEVSNSKAEAASLRAEILALKTILTARDNAASHCPPAKECPPPQVAECDCPTNNNAIAMPCECKECSPCPQCSAESSSVALGLPTSLPKPITPVKMRNDLGDVCRKEKFQIGIEIGVNKGQFAQQILKRWSNFKKYHLVDPWTHQKNYDDVSNVATAVFQGYLRETHDRLNKYGSKVVFHEKFSTEVVHLFQDESVDFIYVDARHDYNGVKEDLTLFWPKLKVGGIMAGHDFLNQEDLKKVDPRMDWTLNGDGTRTVDGKASRAAAEEFAISVGRQLVVTYKDETNNNFPTYYMRK